MFVLRGYFTDLDICHGSVFHRSRFLTETIRAAKHAPAGDAKTRQNFNIHLSPNRKTVTVRFCSAEVMQMDRTLNQLLSEGGGGVRQCL